jgi:septal ring factor EnvC (AmiA/AmiB activator)
VSDAHWSRRSLADAARSRAQTLDRDVRQAEEQIATLDARLSLARITEADLEVRVDRLRAGLSRVADKSPEEQREVVLGLVFEAHLAVGCPLVLKIWPSPEGVTASLEVNPDGGARTSGTMVEQD